MHIIKKLIDVGKTSKGIIIPKTWLDFVGKEFGQIDLVSIEVNGKITISPISSKIKTKGVCS
jgi:hypothetical protein